METIEIKVNAEQRNLNHSQLQMIRRMIAVMQEYDFNINLTFLSIPRKEDNDGFTQNFIGGKYIKASNPIVVYAP
jgi:hypothetical protein